MANKQDVVNAYYEGICTACSQVPEQADAVLCVVDHSELEAFISSEKGEQYAHLFYFDGGKAYAAL